MAPLLSSTVARMGFLPSMRLRRGAAQFFLPEWSYDAAALIFFPVNWLITTAASRLPRAYAAQDWTLDPELQPCRRPAPRTSLRELAASLRKRDDARLSDEEVWSLFDSLPALSANDMLGNWRGKVVRSGSLLDPALLLESPLRRIGFDWGKRYFSAHRGDPFTLMFRGKVLVPVPIWGNVSLPEIRFRGKSGATMTYDHQPWKDHFRVLDDGRSSDRRMLLGNWFSREKNGGWFTLEELPELSRDIADLLLESPA